MQIKGFQKVSFIDYPGKISSVVFLPGCNFKCGFCHNRALVLPKEIEKLKKYSEKEILQYLKKNRNFIDAVVISGGEPTLHDLEKFLKKVKELGFEVKLDTNGSNPRVIEKLIKENLIDYIAMDIKTSLEEYGKIVKSKNPNEIKRKIKQSINIIKNFKEYEFRTTIVPGLVKKTNLLKIASLLKKLGANKKFVLQQFVPRNCVDPAFLKIERTSLEELKELRQILEPFFEKVEIRTE
ncbi:MAG: anaerobic ribonucleoside-triphosphate reductase activating protein [Candidatus Pacearchaeota archaeon]